MVVVVLDIVVACSLLAVFESVNRSVAIMAAVFRIAYATVFLVAISQLVSALALLGDADEALQAVGQFHTIWDASYALFGVHLALIGYLVYRSGFAPRLLGVLLVFATWSIGRVSRRGFSASCSSWRGSDIWSTRSDPCWCLATRWRSPGSASSAKPC